MPRLRSRKQSSGCDDRREDDVHRRRFISDKISTLLTSSLSILVSSPSAHSPSSISSATQVPLTPNSVDGQSCGLSTAKAHSMSPTPARSLRLPHEGRVLRWTRLVFYGFFAPLLLYGLYVQLVVLKGPGRTPIPAALGFGRDTVFLTFHGNVHCTWYACLCLLHALISIRRSRKAAGSAIVVAVSSAGQNLAASVAGSTMPVTQKQRRPSVLVRRIERTIHYYTAPLFALGTFVGVAYYLLLHFHPLSRIRARMVPDYDQIMALLHLAPLLFVAGDTILKDEELLRKHGMTERNSSRFIVMYGLAYFFWTVFCVSRNGGLWPYPFQPGFTAIQHIMFVFTVLLCATYLTRTAHFLMGRLDRSRRRRLAAAPSSRPPAQHIPHRCRQYV